MGQYQYLYNNFQFYENEAFEKYLDRKASEGYELCGIFGRFASVLKFRRTTSPVRRHHAVYCKHLDEEIDAEIENNRNSGFPILGETIQFIIFEIPQGHSLQTAAKETQNRLLSVSPKKSCIEMIWFILLFTFSLTLKLYLSDRQADPLLIQNLIA